MFPIMMDEPDAMSVAPSVWHTLESAWRGKSERKALGASALRAGPSEAPLAPSALASLALGTVNGNPSGVHH